MLTSAKFFESFDKAGFLKLASWTPSFGGDTLEAKVRMRTPDGVFLEGTVVASDPQMEYVTEQLPGLVEGEWVRIDGTDYLVRGTPMKILDGTVSRADLKRH